MKFLRTTFFLLTCSLVCSLASVSTSHAEESKAPTIFSATQLQADLNFLQQTIKKTHPDLPANVLTAEFEPAYQQLSKELQSSSGMTQQQAWLAFARLNAVFADANLAVVMPNTLAHIAQHLQEGGSLFPFEVQINAQGKTLIRSEAGGAASALQGAEILQINGKPTAEIVKAMLERVPGDTAEYRAAQLSLGFAILYWQMQGDAKQVTLQIKQKEELQTITPAGSRQLPQVLREEKEQDQYFRYEKLSAQTALLTLKSFAWADKEKFYAFTQQAFSQMRDDKIKYLLIDVRANAGGNDQMWTDGVLRYLASKPYRVASRYVKRVLAGQASGKEKVGAIAQGEVDEWIQPKADEPLHFAGRVFILTGRRTYASALRMSSVMQDFGMGKIIAEAGIAKTRQSSGAQTFQLTNTGLQLTVPAILLERPTKRRASLLLSPDINLPDSAFDERQLIKGASAYVMTLE